MEKIMRFFQECGKLIEKGTSCVPSPLRGFQAESFHRNL